MSVLAQQIPDIMKIRLHVKRRNFPVLQLHKILIPIKNGPSVFRRINHTVPLLIDRFRMDKVYDVIYRIEIVDIHFLTLNGRIEFTLNIRNQFHGKQ
ncbi:hypothetical protein D3C74_433400 [compost metagenome]